MEHCSVCTCALAAATWTWDVDIHLFFEKRAERTVVTSEQSPHLLLPLTNCFSQGHKIPAEIQPRVSSYECATHRAACDSSRQNKRNSWIASASDHRAPETERVSRWQCELEAELRSCIWTQPPKGDTENMSQTRFGVVKTNNKNTVHIQAKSPCNFECGQTCPE